MIGEPCGSQPNPSPLFFVSDKLSKATFLVDTGASFSVLPMHTCDPSLITAASADTLTTIGGGCLPCRGLVTCSVDLGFSRLLTHEFLVTELPYGILGIDFLRRFRLNVDVCNGTLTESMDVERCARDLLDEASLTDEDAFAPRIESGTNDPLLTGFKTRYPEVFDPQMRSKSILHSVEATIETLNDKVVTSKARRLNPEKFQALKLEIKRLLDAGIIEPSYSEFSSPIVMVAKKNGTFRMCADLTNLNKVLKTHKYSLPNVHDFANMAHDCQYFTTMDIKDAYYVIPVRPSDKHKLTIATPLGNFQYNFLPMGLATSSCFYQKLMNEVVSGLPNVFAYLDDIIVMSKSKDDHMNTLHQLFSRLKMHGLVVNESKCSFCQSSLIFLGHRVSASGISPSETKVRAINEFPQPRTKKQLQRYLGMYQYYNKFVKHSSQWLQPLHTFAASTPNNRALRWTDELISSFEQSKTELSRATSLAYPDPYADTELVVDASGSHIGAILQQVKNNEHAPLAFWSKALTASQRAWSTFDRELYACYASIRYFQYFLDAKDFTLRSDHKPLVHKFHSSTLSSSPRQQRYLDYIAQFTNKFDYVKGEFNVADVVSRPTEDPSNVNAILPQQERLDYLAIARAQHSDPEINLLCRTNDTSLQLVEVPLADHDFRLLCDSSRCKLRPIIPSSLRTTVFKHYHHWSHPGTRTSIKLIGDRFVWPGMRKDIAEWTRECQSCSRAKITRHNKAPLAAVSPPPTERFTHIYVDLTGPLVQSHGYSYLMVIVDRFSRFIHAIPLVGISATECVSAFIHQWVALFGCPEKIFCDRGAQFTSSLWTEMSNYLGCEMKHSTAYHPQSQGLVERFNRSLKSSLRAYENSSDWYDNLPWVLLALRNSPKQDLHSLSPSDFVFGQPVRLPGEFFEVNSATQFPTHEYVSKFSKYISRLAYCAPRTANRESHLDAALFSPSCTHVYIRIDSHRSSLAPFYRGPYRVISKHAKYFSVDFRGHSDTVSIDRLKAAQFSFASLNEEVASSSTAHIPPDFDPCDLASHNSSPLTESHSIHIDISEPLTHHVSQQTPSPIDLTSDTSVHFTTRGRMVRPPSRLRDFVL